MVTSVSNFSLLLSLAPQAHAFPWGEGGFKFAQKRANLKTDEEFGR